MEGVNRRDSSIYTHVDQTIEGARLSETESFENGAQASNDHELNAPVSHPTLRGRAEVGQTSPQHRISLSLSDIPEAVIRDAPFASIAQHWRSAKHSAQMADMRMEARFGDLDEPDPEVLLREVSTNAHIRDLDESDLEGNSKVVKYPDLKDEDLGPVP